MDVADLPEFLRGHVCLLAAHEDPKIVGRWDDLRWPAGAYRGWRLCGSRIAFDCIRGFDRAVVWIVDLWRRSHRNARDCFVWSLGPTRRRVIHHLLGA